MLKVIQKYKTILIFAFLAFIIINPFQEGYFFLLDNVAFPHPAIDVESVLKTPFGWLMINNILPFILTSAFAQKFTFFLSLVFLGLGGFRLCRRFGAIAAYFGGLFAILNPQVYARMLDGQMNVILGLIFLLWGTVYLMEYYAEESLRNILTASLFFAFAINFMGQAIFMVFLIFLVMFFFNRPKKGTILKSLLRVLLAAGIILFLNFNWIADQLFFDGDNLEFITQTINADHFRVFASEAGGKNIYFNTLSLHGYWGEGAQRFLPSTYFIKNWPVAFLTIFFFVILGLFYGLKEKKWRKNTQIFLTLAIIAYVLSIGLASPHFGALTQWMYDHVPLYKGFRESQKWSVILLISYLYLSGVGLKYFFEWKLIQQAKIAWTAIVLMVPVFYTSSMLFGFMGQLRAQDYPSDWYQLYEELNNEAKVSKNDCQAKKERAAKECYDLLAFPWHQYMSYRFTGKNTKNPLSGFFHSLCVLEGDNIEIGNIYTQSTRPESKIIEKYVGPGSNRNQMAGAAFLQELTNLGIRYILVAKEVDWEVYNIPMKKNRQLKEIWDSESFLLYEIMRGAR